MTGGNSATTDAPLQVLFSVRPYRGHLHPMIPLARAFFRRGHKVAVATSEDMAEVVVGAGLAWIPAGINPRQITEVTDRSDPDYGYVSVRTKVDDLLEATLGDFRPDLIVRDPTDLAPVIVSEVVGAMNAIYGLSRFIPLDSWFELGADRTITRLRREFRLPPDPQFHSMFSGVYLAVVPALLEVQDPLPVESVLPVPYVPWDSDAAESSTGQFEGERTRPRVLVTLGTVYNTESDLFRRMLAALEHEDVDVVCALGDGAAPEMTEHAPANVVFARYVPFSKVLPHCDAMLCHGGFNTVMSALLAGVPAVIVPLGSDHDYNAYICRREGFGVWLDEADASPEAIRAAVNSVLHDPSFKERIGEFQESMAAIPTQAAAVRRIETLVANRQPAHR